MSSIQCQRNAAEKAGEQLSYQENVNLDELIKKAEQVCNSEDLVNQSVAIVAEHDGLAADGGKSGVRTFKMAYNKHGSFLDSNRYDDQLQSGTGIRSQGFNTDGLSRRHGIDQFQGFGQDQRNDSGVIKQGGHGAVQPMMWTPGIGVVAPIALGLLKRITVVVGALKSQTRGPLRVYDTKKWAGHVVKNFPNPLDNSTSSFSISAMTEKGIKAAVVYTGKNCAKNADCGWLLALADTKSGGKRVYAECGPMSNFYGVNWAKIEQKLDASGSTAKCSDYVTGTSVYATLVGATKKDLLAASFSG